MSFPDNYPRPWNMGHAGIPLEQMAVSQGLPEGYTNLGDPQGRAQFFPGDYSRVQGGLPLNPPHPNQSGTAQDHKDGKGVLSTMPLPPPPPPPLPHHS